MGEIPHYPEIEPIRRLPEEGRELIGKQVTLWIKRDGEQTRVSMLDDTHTLRISGHNMDDAPEDVVNQFRLIDGLTAKLSKLLLQMEDLVLYGELCRAGNGPTRIERIRAKPSWVLFDARHTFLTDLFMRHDNLARMAELHGLEIAPLYKTFVPSTMDELLVELEQAKVYCRNNRLEGVVGKVLDEAGELIVFKSKIERSEIPKELFTEEELRPKQKAPEGPQLPPMDEHRVLRALQHAFDARMAEANLDTEPRVGDLDMTQLQKEAWNDKGKTMPLIMKYLKLESEEHQVAVPRNAYALYLETPIEKLRGDRA